VTTTATESRVAVWARLHPKWEKRVAIAGLVIVAIAAIGFPLLNKYWPFRLRNVKPLLETVFASQITIDHYHRIYFPHPGFVAEGLTMRRKTAPDQPPISSAQQITVQGNWLDLLMLHSRIRLVDVQGLHVIIPPVGSRANQEEFPPGSSSDFAGPDTLVETLHMHNAVLDILRDNGGRYSFAIHDLALRNVHAGQAASYVVDMQNAKPGGRIQAHGSFGPITPSNLGGTPLSGDFVFSPVNLGDIGDLKGTLSAQGHFAGRLEDIEANATAHTPDFAIGTGRPTDVSGSVQATVNGLDGGVVLHTVELATGKTVVHAGGAIMGSPKVANIDLDVEKGRAQDLMRPFVHDLPPITGVVWLKAHSRVAHGGEGVTFLQRLAVDGAFSVPAEKMTDHATEQSLTAFSARAQGAGDGKGEAGNPDTSAADVVSSVTGQVKIRNGVVSTDRLKFQMPGAVANLKGTYALQTGAAHLTGDMKMDADISHAATGFKSALLKPLAPLFKRKKAGADVPIAVTGVPGQYKVGQDILHTK
jgi:hypothetical protein